MHFNSLGDMCGWQSAPSEQLTDRTLLWCLKDQANGHLREFIGLLFYQKLSQVLVKAVIEIGDFFLKYKQVQGRKACSPSYFCLKSSKKLSLQHPRGEDREEMVSSMLKTIERHCLRVFLQRGNTFFCYTWTMCAISPINKAPACISRFFCWPKSSVCLFLSTSSVRQSLNSLSWKKRSASCSSVNPCITRCMLFSKAVSLSHFWVFGHIIPSGWNVKTFLLCHHPPYEQTLLTNTYSYFTNLQGIPLGSLSRLFQSLPTYPIQPQP